MDTSCHYVKYLCFLVFLSFLFLQVGLLLDLLLFFEASFDHDQVVIFGVLPVISQNFVLSSYNRTSFSHDFVYQRTERLYYYDWWFVTEEGRIETNVWLVSFIAREMSISYVWSLSYSTRIFPTCCLVPPLLVGFITRLCAVLIKVWGSYVEKKYHKNPGCSSNVPGVLEL